MFKDVLANSMAVLVIVVNPKTKGHDENLPGRPWNGLTIREKKPGSEKLERIPEPLDFLPTQHVAKPLPRLHDLSPGTPTLFGSLLALSAPRLFLYVCFLDALSRREPCGRRQREQRPPEPTEADRQPQGERGPMEQCHRYERDDEHEYTRDVTEGNTLR